jgi:putative ABC transport system ATP-binding protein
VAPFLTAGPYSARDGEGRVLFDGLGIALEEGSLSVLDGPSGSGKSTLLRQLVGLVPTPAADRTLAGEGFGPRELPRWRSRVVLMAQDAPMLAGTVGDNLRFPFTHRGAPAGRPDERRLGELLAATGLGAIPESRAVATLSGGERHRLALARGLLWDPPVLVADEPLSGLDEDAARTCFDLLLGFARRPGHAALVVLHDRSRAHLADHRLALRRGGGGEA